MKNNINSKHSMPKDIALQLCNEIRQLHGGKLYTFAGMQCWGCTTFSRGDPNRMCFSSQADYRGCNLVNSRYEKMVQPLKS
jgi:hypothetical protein